MDPKYPKTEKKWGRITLTAGRDPLVEWGLNPARAYLVHPQSSRTAIPVLLRLEGITVTQLLSYFEHKTGKGNCDPALAIPSFYSSQDVLADSPYVTGTASDEFFTAVADSDELRKKVEIAALGPPLPGDSLLDESALPPIPCPPVGPLKPKTVVVGVIDDGIAYANERFTAAQEGTRVHFAWLQDGAAQPVGSYVPYGRELWKHDHDGIKGLDSLIADCTVAGFLDEEKLYRLTGLIDFGRGGHKAAAWRAAHGTHVMDLACGYDPAENRHDRPIICVQLPTAITADTAGTRLDGFVLDGIRYILERADLIASCAGSDLLPVVINFSYGLIAGPHDGTSELEDAIDKIVEARNEIAPFAMSIPAGNSHLSRTHAQIAFKDASERLDLTWRVQPDDRASSFMEIWMPYRPLGGTPPTRMKVTITPPEGPTSPAVEEVDGTGYEWRPHGDAVAWLLYNVMPAPTERGRFLLALLPTYLPDPVTDLAPAGAWTVTLHNVSLTDAEKVEAWIQRGDTPYGYPPLGRQSYFDEACYVRFDAQGREVIEDIDPPQPPCVVKRESLINAIATGKQPIVAGGFHRRELRAAKYSAGGPITPARGGSLPPSARKPDALTVSDDSTVHSGVLAAGTRSNSVVAFNGTSVAGPQLARWAAEELAQGNAADRAAVKAEAQTQEGNLPAWKPPLPANRGGWGRISKIKGLPVVPLPRYWD